MGTQPYLGCSSDLSPLSFFPVSRTKRGKVKKKMERGKCLQRQGLHAYMCVIMVNYKYKIHCLYYYYF